MELISSLLIQYPGVSSFLAIVGCCRILIKPTMSVIRGVTKITPTSADDQLADKIEQSKAFKTGVYVLDWLTSIQLPIKKG